MNYIETHNLTKIFSDGFQAVDDISFSISEPGIYALLGVNGAGKTTLLRLLSGIFSPSSGALSILEKPFTSDNFELKKHLGFFTEYTGLYARLTGFEFLMYSAQMSGLDENSAKIRIEEISDLLFMDDFIHKRCAVYSTGQKQKISLARTILHDPDIYIFDEPYAGLDIITSQIIVDFILTLKKNGKIVIFSTHLISEAEKFSDTMLCMHKGRLLDMRPLSELNTSLENHFLSLIQRIDNEYCNY